MSTLPLDGPDPVTPRQTSDATVEVPALDFETTTEVGYYQLIWRRFTARSATIIALGILATLVVACFILPWYLPALAPSSAAGAAYQGISAAHPFGTDEVGRDLFVRNMLGGQVSLTVGVFAMVTTMVVAAGLGAIAGFFGGLVDTVLTSISNAVLAIPAVLILIIFAAIATPSVATIVIGITLVSWPGTMRIVRSVVLSLREKEYIEAARAVGTSGPRIIMRHVIPNALGPIIVSASLTVVAAILTESAISFLGVGIAEPTPTWGTLLNNGRGVITSQGNFLYAFWPGLLILVTVMCFNYIGDALRDAFDPRALDG